MKTPIEIGSRLELLLDDHLIDRMRDVTFQLHPPRRAEDVLPFDRPWEGFQACYVTVFADVDLYRMYYACYPFGTSDERQYTAYAESEDGVRWHKPNLGLVEFDGSRDNNLLWAGPQSHNFSPFIDTNPAAPADQHYKAVGGNGRAFLLASADAIHWRLLQDEPIIDQDHPGFDEHGAAFYGDDPAHGRAVFDSHNVVFYDQLRQQYVFYYRARDQRHTEINARTVYFSTSVDAIHWTEARPVQFSTPPSLLDQFYTNGIQPYFRAPHLYVALPMRYASRPRLSPHAPKDGLGEGAFMCSRDGEYFHRYMESYLRPGPDRRDWTKHNNMFAWGMLPTSDIEISLYFIRHHYAPTAHLQRGVIRTDGFVSLRAPYDGGEFTTKPLVFTGNELILNASTGAAGGIRVEVQDEAGQALEGFRLEDCEEFYGDEIAHTVRWTGERRAGTLAGRAVQLRFGMRDADLYSIQLAD